MSICIQIQFKIKELPHPHILRSVLISFLSNPNASPFSCANIMAKRHVLY
jgi:hypothetical protein